MRKILFDTLRTLKTMYSFILRKDFLYCNLQNEIL